MIQDKSKAKLRRGCLKQRQALSLSLIGKKKAIAVGGLLEANRSAETLLGELLFWPGWGSEV